MDIKEKRICYAAFFNTPDGKVILQDLKDKVEALSGGLDTPDSVLRSAHGCRYLIKYIENCIKSGEKNG